MVALNDADRVMCFNWDTLSGCINSLSILLKLSAFEVCTSVMRDQIGRSKVRVNPTLSNRFPGRLSTEVCEPSAGLIGCCFVHDMEYRAVWHQGNNVDKDTVVELDIILNLPGDALYLWH